MNGPVAPHGLRRHQATSMLTTSKRCTPHERIRAEPKAALLSLIAQTKRRGTDWPRAARHRNELSRCRLLTCVCQVRDHYHWPWLRRAGAFFFAKVGPLPALKSERPLPTASNAPISQQRPQPS